MQIVIDLKDLYTECEGGCEYGDAEGGDFNEVLKHEIETQVVSKIIRGFTPAVTEELKRETKEKFVEMYSEKVDERINKAIERGIFVDNLGNTFNINTLVKQKFENSLVGKSHFTNAIEQEIKSQIAEMMTVLKDRYDLQFASGIIKNLKDGGLLKEGAEEMLLNGLMQKE